MIGKISDNTIQFINKQAAELFALEPAEIIGKPVNSRYMDPILWERILEKLKRNTVIKDREFLFSSSVQNQVYLSLSATTIHYQGEEAYYLAFADISQGKKLESELKEREERFSTFFHEVPDPLLILSRTGTIQEINKSGLYFFSAGKHDILETDLKEHGWFSESDIDILNDSLNAGRIITGYETTVELSGDRKKSVLISLRPITILNKTAGLLLVHDINEMKQVQNSFSQANNQLSLLNSITRHDILNRVMVVRSYCEILLSDIGDEIISDRIKRIFKASEDIQDLIEFTRQYQDLGVNPPLWQRIDHLIKRRNIQSLLTGVQIIIPDRMIEIYADPMLEKVLYNLVENSVRHGGKVTLITISFDEKADGLVLRYEDNGIGISEEERTFIFKKGFGKNTGLGLFLIREILQITRITITECGKPGLGVRFEMLVPAGFYHILG
jgi:PAS domain S-box-containing protein